MLTGKVMRTHHTIIQTQVLTMPYFKFMTSVDIYENWLGAQNTHIRVYFAHKVFLIDCLYD